MPKLQLMARDRHATGEMSIHKVFTTWNPADLGTKALCASQFMTHAKAWMETRLGRKKHYRVGMKLDVSGIAMNMGVKVGMNLGMRH